MTRKFLLRITIDEASTPELYDDLVKITNERARTNRLRVLAAIGLVHTKFQAQGIQQPGNDAQVVVRKRKSRASVEYLADGGIDGGGSPERASTPPEAASQAGTGGVPEVAAPNHTKTSQVVDSKEDTRSGPSEQGVAEQQAPEEDSEASIRRAALRMFEKGQFGR